MRRSSPPPKPEGKKPGKPLGVFYEQSEQTVEVTKVPKVAADAALKAYAGYTIKTADEIELEGGAGAAKKAYRFILTGPNGEVVETDWSATGLPIVVGKHRKRRGSE